MRVSVPRKPTHRIEELKTAGCRVKLHDDRLILWCDDVFVKDGPLLGEVPDGEMRSAAAPGLQAAQTDSHPHRLPAARHVDVISFHAGPEDLTVSNLDGVLRRGSRNTTVPLPLNRLRGLVGKRPSDDRIRRTEVAIDVRRRECQQRSDAIEAVPAWVFIQRAGQLAVVMNAEQIVSRVGILVAAESIERHRPSTGHASCLAIGDAGRDPVHNASEFLSFRLWFIFRRHLTRVHPEHDLAPALGRCLIDKLSRQRVEPELPLLFLRSMATQAVSLEEGRHDLIRRHIGGETGA